MNDKLEVTIKIEIENDIEGRSSILSTYNKEEVNLMELKVIYSLLSNYMKILKETILELGDEE